jgi:hypothetical protein
MADARALAGALEAVDRLVNRGGEADDILREIVRVLHERIRYGFVGIAFVEAGELALGPALGTPGAPPASFPVMFEGRPVAELQVQPAPTGDHERAFLARVATLASPYCLVGWDTGGERWEP